MKVASLHCSSTEQLKAELNGVIASQFVPTLALVFTSTQHDTAAITTIFTALNINVVGCTTAGEIVDNELLEGTIAVFLMDIKQQHYKILTEKYEYHTIFQAASRISKQAKDFCPNPGLLTLTSGLKINAEELIKGLKKSIGDTAPIYGALAGDDLKMTKTLAFTNQIIDDSCIAAVVIDNDIIEMYGKTVSGWEAVGVENTITKAKENKIYSINNEPAAIVFSRYFGFSGTSSEDKDPLIRLQTNYPFQFIKKEGHTILRSTLVIDKEEESITITTSVTKGDKFRFSCAADFDIIEQTISDFGDIHKQYPQIDGALLFSCTGRHGAFGPLLEKEITGIFNYWQKPMAGFLSYGEIGNSENGICEFHNVSCSFVLFKEK